MDTMLVLLISLMVLIVAFGFVQKRRALKMQPLVQEYLEKGAIVVDVRTPEEYKGGHCAGSLNIPLGVLPARSHELNKQDHIIVCCASGGRSANALNFLKSLGFKNVVNAGPWTNARKV